MTWLIGDVQGCLHEAKTLVAQLPGSVDTPLLFVGDLINRGPDSYGVMNWLSTLSRPSMCLLGNHEIGALAGILSNDLQTNRDLHWLKPLSNTERQRYVDRVLSWPLVHEESDWIAVHGGIPPSWDDKRLVSECQSATDALRRDPAKVLLSKTPDLETIRETIHRVTRLRFVSHQGLPDFSYKGAPEGAPRSLKPWFEARQPLTRKTIYFGHWAALGARTMEGYQSLDAGCVWGKELVACSATTREVVKIPSTRPPRQVSRPGPSERA